MSYAIPDSLKIERMAYYTWQFTLRHNLGERSAMENWLIAEKVLYGKVMPLQVFGRSDYYPASAI